MTESSNLNLDLHHQHEGFHGASSSSSSSSLAAPPPFHFAATSNRNHDWNQHHHLLLNNGGDDDQFMPTNNGALHPSPRDFMRSSQCDMAPVQDLGSIFQWPTAHEQGYVTTMNHHHHSSLQEQLVSTKGVKEELSESFAKLAGVDVLQNYHLIMSSSSLQPEVGEVGFVDNDPMGNLGGFGRGLGSFCTVLPTANISAGSNQLPSPYSSNSPGMDVRALDLSSSGRFGRTLCQPAAVDSMALLREDLAYLQELPAAQPASLSQKPQLPSSNFSGVKNQEARGARSNGLEYRATQSVAKKPRLESRASFTPFKVRKEKLGDRIAALQQLVAPFGKTDTASVLMEAIGYIKFLQDQVETLSVPYMRSSNNKKMRTSEETSTEERSEEPKLDLRSRGLCLVPLSCTSYVTDEINGGVWSPPNYRGGGP
ncbi:transcription factor bHLH110 [Iris pallida]|uniref:Transcription factor bHLH110 n=1 Tax=Iris pallida TaxID=29817 RepID=A0AAX6F5J6_IRIPA|nr:transcription factor bHLH110 [Iris pallida]